MSYSQRKETALNCSHPSHQESNVSWQAGLQAMMETQTLNPVRCTRIRGSSWFFSHFKGLVHCLAIGYRCHCHSFLLRFTG